MGRPGHPSPRPTARDRRHAAERRATGRLGRGGGGIDAAGRGAQGRREGDGHVREGVGAGAGYGAEYVRVRLSLLRAPDARVWRRGGGEDV